MMISITGTALLALGAVLFGLSQFLASRVEARFPPVGEFVEVDGRQMHVLDIDDGAVSDAGQPAILFIHGASSNLRDLSEPLAKSLTGELGTAARLVFVDRPGHGYSQRSNGAQSRDHLPDGQADVLAGVLDRLDIERAVVVGHSYGGAVAAAMAVNHPQRVAGLVFLTPATHPWPGAGITWYYRVAQVPVIGWLFTRLVAVPGGNLLYRPSVKGVFHPEPVPDAFEERSGTRLVLRPGVFANNARDVASLHDAVTRLSPEYPSIGVPTAILTGDRDRIVLPEIHSEGLRGDIDGARLVWLEGDGHMPQWTRREEVVREILAIHGTASTRDAETAGLDRDRP